jgi:hypothetical protein
MKSRFLFSLILTVTCAGLLPATLRAKDIYVFRIQLLVAPNTGIRDTVAESTSLDATGAHPPSWQILPVPVTLRFDHWTHAPASEEFAWTVATLGTKKFSLLSMPTIITNAGQKATVFIGSTAQYFEKQADGSFLLQQLPKDPRGSPQPNSPHYALTLLARPDDTTTGSLVVTFASDIVVLTSREKIPGVDLDVGKPVTTTIQDEQTFTARLDAWTALLCRAPGGSDYSLLLLLNGSQQEANAEPTGQKLVPAAHSAQPVGPP